MRELEERIIKDGRSIGSGIVKVDGFLNHQLDTGLIMRMGEEFARLFAGSGANKIFTVESSGIAIALAAAVSMGDLPVVYAKKSVPSTMSEFYSTAVHSFTKNVDNTVIVSRSFIGSGDRLLIIDDFLATGSAGLGLVDLARQAGAEIVGFGAAIEKTEQGGRKALEDLGIEVRSLAVIASIEDGNIIFNH